MKEKAKRISFALILLLLLLSVIPAQAEAAAATGPEQIVLSLTGEPTEMAVTWCDKDDSSDRTVVYGTDPGLSGAYTISADTTVSVSGLHYYEATMTSLSPGQTYYYRVGSDGNMSGIKSFKAESAGSDYEFIYLGDVQFAAGGSMETEYDAWSSLVQGAYAKNTPAAFFLQGGDMVNNGQNPEEWQSILKRGEVTFSEVPLVSVPGNHESNDESGKPVLWSKIFDLPDNGPAGFKEEFYSFDYGNSHITCLNSNILSNEQLNYGTMTAADFDRIKAWIADDLSSSSKKWKIVVLHHPAYIVVSDSVAEKVLDEWAPIFEDNGVSLVFCGHQHVYMRTCPMFDREISTDSGITYIMGNSGSKFYASAEVPYDACMIANQSTYQTVSVATSGITVKTYDASGSLLDSAVVVEPTATEHAISLSYDAAVATVTAPAVKISGSAVTVNVSNIASGKQVQSVAVEDKNGRNYNVTTLTANSAYSFAMPNRSVTVKVLFENSSTPPGPSDTYYTCSVSTGGDPIWNIGIASSGISPDDSSKIKAGYTVTVSVSRAADAINASLKGLNVSGGSSAVTVTAVPTPTKAKGKYQFTMPEANVTISPEASYESLKIYARQSASDSYSLKDTLSRNEMPVSGINAYYTGYDSFPTAVVGKAEEYVYLEDLLKACGIELTNSSSIEVSAIDGATRTYTYDFLYGSSRYYYPELNSKSSSGKKVVKPMLVIRGYQSRYIDLPSGSTIDAMAADTAMAYRFAFGQTQEDFNNGTPSLDHVTVRDFLKWTNSIKVTGYKAVEEEKVPEDGGAGGGGGVAVDAEIVINKEGVAAVKLEEAAIKESLNKALEKAKTENAIPQINISVATGSGIKAVEVTVPKAVMKELASTESLLVRVSTPFGSATLDSETLETIRKQNSDQEIKITIAPVEKSQIKNTDGREMTGDIVGITITSGTKEVTEFGGRTMKIQIPFTPDPAKNVKGYYVVWLADDGKSRRMPGAGYDSADRAMEFDTTHLSTFAVAYTTNTAVNVFSDVGEDAWYAPYATFVTEKGYFQGTDKTTFGPDVAMTRAMLVTVLGRINSVDTAEYTKSAFGDVGISSWYGGYAQWAYQNGIVSGVGAGRFAPNQPVTREQLSEIFANYYKWKNASGKTAPIGDASSIRLKYKDGDQISGWANDGVAFCVEKEWLSGYPDGNFKPSRTASRAEVAKMLKSVCE